MELSGIMARIILGAEYVTVFLLWLSVSGYSDKLKEIYMPGETCGYIETNRDQYRVQSIKNKPPDATTSDSGQVVPYTPSYPANVSCSITFRTTPDMAFLMRMISFEIQPSRKCEKDGVFLYNGAEAIPEYLFRSHGQFGLCGLTLSLPNYFISTGNEVTVKFVTDATDNSYNGFQLVITPFYEGNCTDDEFQCGSGKCITRDAQCNQVYNCKDGSDEPSNCHLCATCGSTTVFGERTTACLWFIVAFIGLITTHQFTFM